MSARMKRTTQIEMVGRVDCTYFNSYESFSNILISLVSKIFFRNQQVKKRWVIETGRKKGGDILAVQTLRNWILASTFLATGKLV